MSLPRVEPILPTLTRVVPLGREWMYELKLDGFRGVLHIDAGTSWFTSKTNNAMPRFRDLAAACARELAADSVILDGEIIVLGADARPDFNALFSHSGTPSYAAFDLLWLNGRDLRRLPLWRRKKALAKLVARTAVGLVESVDDPRLYDVTVAEDMEGIVAKRRSDPYGPETQWLKIKTAGYTQAEGRGDMFHRRR